MIINFVLFVLQGVVEMSEVCENDNENVQYFLNRFYSNRIGIRMLITQHSKLQFPQGSECL